MIRRKGGVLRPLTEADLSLVRKWRNSARIRAVMYSDHIITPDEHRKWFRKIRNGRGAVYLVFEFAGHPAGMVYFTDRDAENGTCAWGFYLGETGLPRGTGTMMGVLGLEYAFKTLKIRKLFGETFAFNKASIRFFRRLGFVKEAYFRQHVMKKNRFEDVVVFSLLAREWKNNRKNLAAMAFHD